LEQSHIRTANKNNRGSLYMFCGLTLLAAIVLSNGYRGANIERIGSSYANIPFETFDQLIQNNFDIWTRDVSSNANSSEKEIEKESNTTRIKIPPNKLQLIINYTKVPYKPKYDTPSIPWNFLGIMATAHYNSRSFNASDIVGLISPCNRSAWVDYKPKLATVYEELYKNQTENLYIGKETIFSKDHGISISRWIDPRIPVRLAWLKVSGILDLWVKAYYQKGTTEIIEPVKLSMKGNIVTVFMILLGGLGIATACVMFEFVRFTIQSMKRTINIEFLRASRQVVWLFIILRRTIGTICAF